MELVLGHAAIAVRCSSSDAGNSVTTDWEAPSSGLSFLSATGYRCAWVLLLPHVSGLPHGLPCFDTGIVSLFLLSESAAAFLAGGHSLIRC